LCYTRIIVYPNKGTTNTSWTQFDMYTWRYESETHVVICTNRQRSR